MSRLRWLMWTESGTAWWRFSLGFLPHPRPRGAMSCPWWPSPSPGLHPRNADQVPNAPGLTWAVFDFPLPVRSPRRRIVRTKRVVFAWTIECYSGTMMSRGDAGPDVRPRPLCRLHRPSRNMHQRLLVAPPDRATNRMGRPALLSLILRGEERHPGTGRRTRTRRRRTGPGR